jgi:hypothetical protein
MRMISRLLLSLVLACSLIACTSPQKKKEKEEAAKAKLAAEDAEEKGSDPNFLAFIGRLRKAVAQHDVNMLASMMTTNFGYRLEPVGEGEGVFQYWDQMNIWPQLQAVLDQRFVPKDNFMVAPPDFAATPDKFHGYRAGIVSANGSWKFAYFVTD